MGDAEHGDERELVGHDAREGNADPSDTKPRALVWFNQFIGNYAFFNQNHLTIIDSQKLSGI
jgi:hypothetical protein